MQSMYPHNRLPTRLLTTIPSIKSTVLFFHSRLVGEVANFQLRFYLLNHNTSAQVMLRSAAFLSLFVTFLSYLIFLRSALVLDYTYSITTTLSPGFGIVFLNLRCRHLYLSFVIGINSSDTFLVIPSPAKSHPMKTYFVQIAALLLLSAITRNK